MDAHERYMSGYSKTPLGDGYTEYTEYGNVWIEDSNGNYVKMCAQCNKYVPEDDLDDFDHCLTCQAAFTRCESCFAIVPVEDIEDSICPRCGERLHEIELEKDSEESTVKKE